ncbi:hypothetical protein NVP1256O_73 [Vibrio phage 1.256.O._10N.286.45.F8]|nr:hypothetical protein NVP1256O_73 [Vibrio phage 1.256.O._10N.286.45.F8]
MITKKEDLMNTYIENDFGELRKAYIDKAIELGYNHQGNRKRGLDWYDLPYISINDSWDDAYVGQTADVTIGIRFSESKILTISDLKPRTKTEFVKCEFSREWEAVRYYNEDGELFVVDCNGNYTNVNDISGAWYEVVCKNYHNIYRKVETEIDERQEFIDAYMNKAKSVPACSDADFAGILYDSGKFKLVEK